MTDLSTSLRNPLSESDSENDSTGTLIDTSSSPVILHRTLDTGPIGMESPTESGDTPVKTIHPPIKKSRKRRGSDGLSVSHSKRVPAQHNEAPSWVRELQATTLRTLTLLTEVKDEMLNFNNRMDNLLTSVNSKMEALEGNQVVAN